MYVLNTEMVPKYLKKKSCRLPNKIWYTNNVCNKRKLTLIDLNKNEEWTRFNTRMKLHTFVAINLHCLYIEQQSTWFIVWHLRTITFKFFKIKKNMFTFTLLFFRCNNWLIWDSMRTVLGMPYKLRIMTLIWQQAYFYRTRSNSVMCIIFVPTTS